TLLPYTTLFRSPASAAYFLDEPLVALLFDRQAVCLREFPRHRGRAGRKAGRGCLDRRHTPDDLRSDLSDGASRRHRHIAQLHELQGPREALQSLSGGGEEPELHVVPCRVRLEEPFELRPELVLRGGVPFRLRLLLQG